MKNQVKIGDLTVDELKGELKKRKIAQVGPKVALVKRLKKALTDEGEDPETFVFSKESESESTKGVAENSKSETTKSESEEPKIEEKDSKKLGEEVDTPKRTLRRSTREKSPAIQSAPTTPSKTPRTVKGKACAKLTALTEEDESSSKSVKEESSADTKSEENKDKKPVKKETKKDTKKPEEDEPRNEPAKDIKKDTEDKTERESEKDITDSQDKPKEGKIVNGEKETTVKKSTEKKEEETESESKTTPKKSVDKESSDKEMSDKEEFEMDEEEGKQAELDLDLEDMEQPDYEEELNFDCGSTFISDNDADLDDTQDDGKNRESAKKSRKSGGDKRANSSTVTDTDVSGKPEGDKDTEEDKEKSKSSDKNISEKEDARDSEKVGGDNKGESTFKDLWVTGLSSATKAADLKQAFLKHGKVISTKIVMNPKMSVSQCFGIVTVASQEDAMACVKALNVTELLGRFITVKIIAKKKDKEKDDSSKKKKEDDKDKGDDRKEGSSKKESKFSDEKDKRERELHRDREFSIRKRLGNPRMALRRSPLPFAKRRQEMRRQEQERRQEMVERKRAMYRSITKEAQRQESIRLVRERELLRLERERVERDKVELLKLERERIEREKEELRRQHMRLEEARRKREFGGPRDDFDSRSKRPMNDRYYSDRRPSPAYGGGGPPPYRDKQLEREKKMKTRIPEQLHVKKKNAEYKEVQPARFSQLPEKKHRHKSRSRSREGWKVKDERSGGIYIDEKKMRDIQQIEHLMQMKQKIKQELRMSCNEHEDKSSLKRRKHSRSPPPSKHLPHHQDNHIYHSNVPPSTGRSKPTRAPFISVPRHSVVTSKTSKHRLFSILEPGVI